MLQLRCRIDSQDRIYPLTGEELAVGRGSENDIRLADVSVSRRHALLSRDSMGGWVVEDLDSTNGTKVNGVRTRRTQLMPGDRLQVGRFTLEVEEVTSVSEAGGERTPLSGSGPELRTLAGVDESALSGGGGERPGEASGAVTPPAVAARAAGAGPSTDPSSDPPPRSLRDPSTRKPPPIPARVPNATIVRPLADFNADYGLDDPTPGGPRRAAGPGRGQRRLQETDEAYGDQVFGYLTRLAQLLITAEEVPQILERVLEVAFDALPVERGFILLGDDAGTARCEMARFGDRIEHRPPAEDVPVSQTILDAVMEERLALLTYDALSDERLAAGESIRLHGIRAAMSAPLWSGRTIFGVIQVDSSIQVGAFRQRDLDFLTALANYAAVAVERLRNAERAEAERRLRGRLERYHSPAVIDQVMKGLDTVGDGVGDAGQQLLTPAEATVLFADLVGFTAFTEQADPNEVTELLEGYFNHTVEAIFAAGGTLDKFIGDAVMAFFGAPLPQEDHALRAVRAALEARSALDEWNRQRQADGLPNLAMRIAINSGPVVVGDVGNARRVDYTVLGNTVNVAARLEQFVARPGDIVVGEVTHRMLNGAIPTESLGELQLKGLQQKVHAYRVKGS